MCSAQPRAEGLGLPAICSCTWTNADLVKEKKKIYCVSFLRKKSYRHENCTDVNCVSTRDTIWGETLTTLKWQANPPCLKTGSEPCPCIWLTTFLWSSCSVSETGIPTHKMGYLFHFRDGFIAWHTEVFHVKISLFFSYKSILRQCHWSATVRLPPFISWEYVTLGSHIMIACNRDIWTDKMTMRSWADSKRYRWWKRLGFIF